MCANPTTLPKVFRPVTRKNLKKILGFTSKFREGLVTLNTGIFYFGLNNIIITPLEQTADWATTGLIKLLN